MVINYFYTFNRIDEENIKQLVEMHQGNLDYSLLAAVKLKCGK